jgi:hypothetical protein
MWLKWSAHLARVRLRVQISGPQKNKNKKTKSKLSFVTMGYIASQLELHGKQKDQMQWLIPIIPTTQEGRDQDDHGSKPVPGKILIRHHVNQ